MYTNININMSDLERKLKLLKEEDFIWLIYFFIIIFAIISNKNERISLLFNNPKYGNNARTINSIILIIAFLIYLYFVIVTINNFDLLKRSGSNKDVRVAFVRLIANILFLVAGSIAIYADWESNTTGTDIAIF